jgi:flagellar hook-length control protein FliK
MQFFPISLVYGALTHGGKATTGGLGLRSARAQQNQSLWEWLQTLRQQGTVDDELWQRLTDWKTKGEDGRLALWLAQVCPQLVPQGEALWQQPVLGKAEGTRPGHTTQELGSERPHDILLGGAADAGLWTRAATVAQVKAKGNGAVREQEGGGSGSLGLETGEGAAHQNQGSAPASMRSGIAAHGQKTSGVDLRQSHAIPQASLSHHKSKAMDSGGLDERSAPPVSATTEASQEEAWQAPRAAVFDKSHAHQGFKGQHGGRNQEGGSGSSLMDPLGRAPNVQAGDGGRRPEEHTPAKGILRQAPEEGTPRAHQSSRHAGEGSGAESGHESARRFGGEQRGMGRGRDHELGSLAWRAEIQGWVPEGTSLGTFVPENPAVATAGRFEAASIVEQTAQAMVRQLSPGLKQLTIQIEPQDLGPIHVALQVRGGEVHAVLRPAHAETSQILTNHVPVLRQELERQGFQVARLDVQTGLPDASTQGSWDGAGQHQRPASHGEPGLLWRRSGETVDLAQNLQNMVPEALEAVELSRAAVDLFA